MKRKFAALLLFTVMSFSLLTACTKKESKEKEEATEEESGIVFEAESTVYVDIQEDE